MGGNQSGRWALATVALVGLLVIVGPSKASSPDRTGVTGTAVADLAVSGATGLATTAGDTAGDEPDGTDEPEPLAQAGPVIVDVGTVGGCPWSDGDRARGPDHNRRVVELAYCAILDRPPDDDGLAFWAGELDRGLPEGDFVLALLASPELRARRDDTPLDLLGAFRRGGGPATALAEGTTTAGRPEPLDGLRPQRPLTVEAFDRWVAGQPVDSVEQVTDALVHGRIADAGQSVDVAYVHLSATRGARVSPGDRGLATVGTWAEAVGAHVAVNGNWFGPLDGPAVSDGVVYGGADHAYTSLFGFTADGEVIVEHHAEVNEEVDPRIVEGVSGHPTLIDRGELTTDFGGDPTFTDRHPRTAIALDASGDVLILVTVDGRSATARGMTGHETAELLEQLGANDAVMLDGGGSTTMWIAGQGVVNQPSEGARAVGNELAVFGD